MRSAGETAAARLRALLICVAIVCCMGQSCGTFPPAPVYEEEVLAEHPDAPPDGANDPATPAAPELAIVSGVSPDGWSVDFAVTTLDGRPLPAATFTWDFGDGSSSEGSSVSHTYTKAGIYAVSVSAVIGAGITAYVLRTESEQVIQAPAATEPALRVTPADGLSSLGGRGGPFEPAGRSYTLTSTAGEPLTWSASATEPWLLVSPASGTLAPGAAVEVAVTIDAALAGSLAPGAYEAMVGFVDTTGADPAARPRSSTGRPVKIVVGADKTVRIAGSVRKNGAGFAGVTVTADGGRSSVTDAAGGYALEVPAGWTGRIAPAMTGETFDPPSQAFTSLSGDVSGADFAAVVVVTNQPPMAVAQSVSVAQGGSLAITLSGSDAEGDALDFALDASPSHGVLSGVTVLSAATARVVYTPAAGYSGSDAFSFTVSDGAGISSAALVSITVVPVATGVGPILVPGSGFTGPTDQPAAVGDPLAPGYDAKAIARWDVVPYQTFTGDFNVGVVAFHINGIEKVSFSVNGGPWTDVYEMTLNPQTANHSGIGVQTDGVVEYWATLRASDFADGPVEVRAIAWPVTGIPRVVPIRQLESLPLYANSRGSLTVGTVYVSPTRGSDTFSGTLREPFQTITRAICSISPGGTVILTEPGTYPITEIADWSWYANAPAREGKRWITITPDAGLARDQIVISQPTRSMMRPTIPYLRWLNVTFDFARISQYYPQRSGGVWFDQTLWSDSGGWLARRDDSDMQPVRTGMESFATNSQAADMLYGFVDLLMVRGCSVEKISGDAYQNAKMILNCTARNVDGTVSGHHTDLYQTAGPHENTLIYGLGATELRSTQDLFLQPSYTTSLPRAEMTNCAFVNIDCQNHDLDGLGGPPFSQLQSGFNHVLFLRANLPSQRLILRTDMNSTVIGWGAKNVLFKDCQLHPLTYTQYVANPGNVPAGVRFESCTK